MNFFFCPLLEQFCYFSSILPSCGPFCPDGISFCPLSSSGQENGCFGVRLGVFCVRTYPERGLWRLSKEQGLVVVFWAKWDPIWAKWDPSGQSVQKVGKSALELRGRNPIIVITCFSMPSLPSSEGLVVILLLRANIRVRPLFLRQLKCHVIRFSKRLAEGAITSLFSRGRKTLGDRFVLAPTAALARVGDLHK